MFYGVGARVYAAGGSRKAAFFGTFFAWDQSKALERQLRSTAKKVTPAPGRGELIDRREITNMKDKQLENRHIIDRQPKARSKPPTKNSAPKSRAPQPL
jgi:hypothetical protein